MTEKQKIAHRFGRGKAYKKMNLYAMTIAEFDALREIYTKMGG